MAVCKKLQDSPFHPHLLCVGRKAKTTEKVELDVFWGKPPERRAIAHKELTLINAFSPSHSLYLPLCVFTFPKYMININTKIKQKFIYTIKAD